MRKYICFTALTVWTVAMICTGCRNEVEDYFEKSAAERLNDAVDRYSQIVASSPGGWVMEYYPTNSLAAPTGCGYLIMADIRSDGSVAMTMNNEITGGEFVSDTSMWEVIRDYGPVLSFSTYNNCIHTFCDPAIYETGLGYEGDYEFLIINMEKNAPHAMLKGKKRGVYVRMSRVPEGTDYEDYLEDVAHFQDSILPVRAVNYNLLSVGDSLYKVEEMNSGIPNIYPYDGDAIADESWHPFLITKLNDGYHLRFRRAIEVGDIAIQEFLYDEVNGVFVCTDNRKVTLTGPDPVRFFTEMMNRHAWSWTLNSKSISEDIYARYEAVNQEGGKLKDKYTMKSVQFTSLTEVDDRITVCIDVTFTTSKKKTATVGYLYELEQNNDSVSLKYLQPKDATSENVTKNLPSIIEFLEVIQDSYKPVGAFTNFCMNDLVLNSASGKRITVKYAN